MTWYYDISGVLRSWLNLNNVDRDDDVAGQIVRNFFKKMYTIGRIACFVVAVSFTIISVITNSSYTSHPISLPQPFFNSSWIEDFYGGQMQHIELESSKNNVIFLMLYAPWDADSQNARNVFEETCKYFRGEVYCAAINCWETNPGCKNIWNNVNKYPIFLAADQQHFSTIAYKGEIVASHMIRFLNIIIKPIRRIHSLEELDFMKLTCNAAVITSYTKYSAFLKFYVASIKILENYPRGDICWAVTTNQSLALSLKLKKLSINLYLWDGVVTFQKPYSIANIMNWVLMNYRDITQWIHFNMDRSDILSNTFIRNSAVILFTPNNLYFDYNPTYLMFKAAVIEFLNCLNNKNSDTEYFSHYSNRLLNHEQKIINESVMWKRICDVRLRTNRNTFNSTIIDALMDQDKFLLMKPQTNSTMQYYIDSIFNESDTITTGRPHCSTGEWSDEQSACNLIANHIHKKCRHFSVLEKSNVMTNWRINEFLPHIPNDQIQSDLRRVNRTYSYFAVDSSLYPHLSERLGINIDGQKHRTSIVIFDGKKEETHLLQGVFDSKNIFHEFLINSSVNLESIFKKSSNISTFDNTIDYISVLELNSETFSSVVFNESYDSLVYFYSSSCTYCNIRANSFLSVADSFKKISNDVLFARVNGEINDLPWNLIPHSYPTIIFFPAKKKSESVIFPNNQEFTTENLLNFVIKNVDFETKIKYLIHKCELIQNSHDDLVHCITHVKSQLVVMLEKLVDRYKITMSSTTPSTVILELISKRLKLIKSGFIYLNKIYGM